MTTNHNMFNEGDSCYLFTEFPWHTSLYDLFPLKIMEGVYLTQVPSHVLSMPRNLTTSSIYKNIALTEWVASGFNLQLGPSKVCIHIANFIPPETRDKIFWSIIGSLFLVKPLFIHVSGSFIYGNEIEWMKNPGKHDLRSNFYFDTPAFSNLSENWNKYNFQDIESLKFILPHFLSYYLSNKNPRYFYNIQIYLQAIIFEKLSYKSSIYSKLFPLADSLAGNHSEANANKISIRLSNFLTDIPLYNNHVVSKEIIKQRLFHIWSLHRVPELHGHLKESMTPKAEFISLNKFEIFPDDADYKDLSDLVDIVRVTFLKTLLLKEENLREYLMIPIPSTGKSRSEAKQENKERDSKADEFFLKSQENHKILCFYTDLTSKQENKKL